MTTTVKAASLLPSKKDVVTAREFTLHRGSKRMIQFQNHAPRVLEEVCRFAQQAMGTKQVKMHPTLFQHIWITGISSNNPPIRVRLTRQSKRINNEEATTTYTLVELVEGSTTSSTLRKKNQDKILHQGMATQKQELAA